MPDSTGQRHNPCESQESHIPSASAGASAKENFSAAVNIGGGWQANPRFEGMGNGIGVATASPLGLESGPGTRMATTNTSGLSWSGPLSSASGSGSGDEAMSFGIEELEQGITEYQAVLEDYQPAGVGTNRDY